MQDYLLDGTLDLQIADGDFVLGKSDTQHQQCLLYAQPGAYKQYPTVGVGLFEFLKDEASSDLLRQIRLQFQQDGMTVNTLTLVNGQIQVDAQYD